MGDLSALSSSALFLLCYRTFNPHALLKSKIFLKLEPVFTSPAIFLSTSPSLLTLLTQYQISSALLVT